MNVVRIGGYQGADSILTQSLRQLTAGLRNSHSSWIISLEENVTRQGETARSLFTSIDCGVRHVGYMASSYLVAQVPELALLDIPFGIQDRQHALRMLDGTVGQWLAQCVEQRTAYKLLGYWDNGFRHISNRTRAITCASDCTDLRIRTLDSDVYRRSLASMGFAPVSIDVKDFSQALQAGTVDAQENPLVNFSLFSVGKHHPHLSLSAHFFGVLLLVCHRPWFETLTKTQSEELELAALTTTQHQRQLATSEDSTTLGALRTQGIQTVMHGDIDIASFHRATHKVREDVLQNLPANQAMSYLQ